MHLEWFSALKPCQMTGNMRCLQIRSEGVLGFPASPLESLRDICGVSGVYGAKHSPSSSCSGGPLGWFFGFSQIHHNFFPKHQIFAIWASHASWDEEVRLKIVLELCKDGFGMIFSSQTLSDDSKHEMSADSSGRRSGGLPQVLWRVWEKSEVS